MSINDSKTFTAAASNTLDQNFDWYVEESDGGSITADGTYTAPATPGTYHVIVARTADPVNKTSATVTVKTRDISIVVKSVPSPQKGNASR